MRAKTLQFICVACALAVGTHDAAHSAPPPDAPTPWFGLGADEGLVLLSSVEGYTLDEPPNGQSDEERAWKWLGEPSRLIGVDHIAGLVIDATVSDEIGKGRVGQTLQVIGEDGKTCLVEVTAGVRALMWHTDQFPQPWDHEVGQPADMMYRGPGLRRPWNDAVDYSTEIITPETIQRDTYYGDTRMTALKAKRVNGTCPVDGLVGPVKQFAFVTMKKGKPEHADAVRKLFRGNRWVKKITREFRSDLKEFKYLRAQCDEAVPKGQRKGPRHLDDGPVGLRTTLIEPEGGEALLLAETGASNYCDPGNAAVVYRQKGRSWKQVRELWGDTVRAMVPLMAIVDATTKRVWVAGWIVTPGMSGWLMRVTALDKPGLASKWGSWPDVAAHHCNYGASIWEYASVCASPDADVDDSDPDNPAEGTP